MKKFLLPALAATLLLAATAVAAPLDAFKGMKGTLDIAGGTAHIPVMKEAAKRIMTANPDIRITVAWAYSRWAKGSSRSATRAAR
jgi:phosphate transport system substrate-binding protein